MAIANSQTSSTAAPLINTEWIDAAVRMGPRTPKLFPNLVRTPTLTTTKRYTVTTRTQFSAASAYTETDDVASALSTPTAVNVDTALYAKGAFLSDWGAGLSNQNEGMIATMEVLESLYLRIETDVLATASSMTNSTGSALTINTVDNFIAVTSAFRTQTKANGSAPLMVMSASAFTQLLGDVMSGGNAIFSSSVGPQLTGILQGANLAQWGAFGGYMLTSSDLMPAADTTGKASMIVCPPIDDKTNGLVVPFSRVPQIETQRAARNIGLWVVGHVAMTAGIAEQARCYTFATAA